MVRRHQEESLAASTRMDKMWWKQRCVQIKQIHHERIVTIGFG